MISGKRPQLLTLGVALVLSALALGLTLLTPLKTASPFLLFIVAIIISTRLGGLSSGLFATLLTTAASIYFFLLPIGTFGIASFVLIALVIVVLVSRDLTAQRKSEKAQSLNEELDLRVAQRTGELQAANAQLRLLAAHLQSAREEERTRIAREIHDEIGTLMTAIKMDLAFLVRENGSLKSPASLHEEINATTKLVDDAIESVHHIARELRPGVLDHLGLRAALEWQMQEFQERAKIECQFDSNLDELDLDSARATAVFRIMQETLTNVARHANATRVTANLRQENHSLVLEVRDNGKGFSDAPDTNRFGILGMRERAHVFGGEVAIHGSPGQGTIVTVRIPI
ncbi:MAG: sensor histidine kinase [Chloroflexi bacterium]|nr:sensor histidine kinase [Chloroflexota bacterium]